MGSLGLINFSVWCILLIGFLSQNKVKSDDSIDAELDAFLTPREDDSIHVKFLRQDLLRKMLDRMSNRDSKIYRIYGPSSTHWYGFPNEDKRNVEALARGGTSYKTPPDTGRDEDADFKRSFPRWSKNQDRDYFTYPPLEDQKRGIESLAKNGELPSQRYWQTLRREGVATKRNGGNFRNSPVGTTAGFGKRSVYSLAKNGDLPNVYYGKRDSSSWPRHPVMVTRLLEETKRNIQALKAQQRNKRDVDYFENELVYQMPSDYEEILQELPDRQEPYLQEEKRFMGRIPQIVVKGKPIPKTGNR